jgi:hypothetical protein
MEKIEFTMEIIGYSGNTALHSGNIDPEKDRGFKNINA